MLFTVDSYTIDLLPIHHFYRPVWAYEHHKNGWDGLRRKLFGNTDRLVWNLEKRRDQNLRVDQLNDLLLGDFTIHPEIRPILRDKLLSGITDATQLAVWYKMWENQVFNQYILYYKGDNSPHPRR